MLAGKEGIWELYQDNGIAIKWEGDGVNEKGIDIKTKKAIVKVDPKYFRPAEVDVLLGDASYARKKLGWKPKTTFEQLVNLMVDYDIKKFSEKN